MACFSVVRWNSRFVQSNLDRTARRSKKMIPIANVAKPSQGSGNGIYELSSRLSKDNVGIDRIHSGIPLINSRSVGTSEVTSQLWSSAVRGEKRESTYQR